MECGAALPEAAKFCPECGTKTAAPPPAPSTPPPPAVPEIPPELRSKFEAAQKELRGDRREVVVLFADLKGFTAMSEQLDPEEVSLIMQRLLGELSDAVHRYEGYVDKYIGDAIMALFGAPLAHENDAERAVHAALDMLEAVARRNEGAAQPLSLRVGLNLGDVVAADLGSEGRVQYTVMGDTVNVASRLEGAAQPDSILISHSVYERIAHRFDTEEVPPVTVKGKSEPLRVYRVHGVRAASDIRAGTQTAFVGREKELASLGEFLDRIATGEGQVLLIEAEAGAGKSRLIAEGVARSEAEEAVVEVGFTQIQIPGQISPAAEIFRRLVAPGSEESADSAIERATAILQEQAEEHRQGIVGLARQAHPRGFAEPDSAKGIDPRAARQNRWIALAALIGAFAKRQPTVIVIEDVHWADEEGQEFLAYLIPALSRKAVGFILTARMGGRPGWLAETATLRLEALGEDAASSILGGLLDTMRPSVRREILRRSQGNPLYLEELARSLSATVEDAVQSVPGTVQGLLQSRIDRLEPPVRLVIQMASVLGPQFSVGLLHRMYALDPQPMAFDAALSRLEEQAFVERTEAEDVRRFRHALMQEVAYGGILQRLRKVLHESAAQLGEEHYAERLEAEAPFFAHHYWEADLQERAAPHLFRAATNAAAQYDLPAAERWFGQLSSVYAEHPEVLPDASDRATMMIQYGAVLLDRGRYDAADALFARLDELGSDHKHDEWVGQAMRYRGQIAALRGRLGDSRVLFESGLERVPATELQITADLHTGLGLVLYYSSDGAGALSQFEIALEIYQRIDDRLGQAKCYINIGNVLDDLRNNRKAAEPSYEKALALIEQVGDRRLKTGVLLNLGTLATERGDWDDALTRFLHVESAAEEIGWSFMRFLSLQNQASCNLSLGRIGTAIDLLETCLREGETTLRGDDRIRVRVLLFEAFLAALDLERAAEKLAEARRVAAEIEMEELEDTLRLGEGRLSAATGQWPEASTAFAEALAAATRLGHPMVEPVARAHLSRAASRIGESVEPPAPEEIEQKPTRALVLYLAADAELARDPASGAGRTLEEAGDLAAELGYVTLERAAFERAAEIWEASGNEEARQAALRRAALAMAALEGNLPAELREAFSAHPRNQALRQLVPA
jgi:class 3 adenylate cyclase/tetratricopeptide (TPR) repeat protein